VNIEHWWSDNWHCKTVTVGEETCASHGLPCERTRKCAMKSRWLIGWTVSRSSKWVQEEALYLCLQVPLPLTVGDAVGCESWGIRHGVHEVFATLGFCTASVRSFVTGISRKRVGPSRCPKTSWHWMMVPTRFLEMSVTNYQLTLWNVLEEWRSSVVSGCKFVDAETRMWSWWR
jgi:hypothetical protein